MATASNSGRRRFSGVTPPNAASTRVVGGEPVAFAHGGNFVGPGRHGRHAHPDDMHVRVGEARADLVSQGRAVHGNGARRRHDAPQHRPEVIQRPSQAGQRGFGRFPRQLRVIERQLRAVVVRSAASQQRPGAGVVQVAVVEDDEPRVPEQVGPHEVVAPRVAHLEDRQVVRRAVVPPGKVVRRGVSSRRSRFTRGVHFVGGGDEHVDLGAARQRRDQIARVVGDPAADGRHRGEEGDAHEGMILKCQVGSEKCAVRVVDFAFNRPVA